MSQWTRSLLGICLLLSLWLGMTAMGIASVHKYPEGAGKVMVRSLQTLRDRRDQAWQVVLYKQQDADQTTHIHLRLVGFPGSNAVKHPAMLQIVSSNRRWLAADVLPLEAGFPATVGEYDVLDVLPQLHSNAALQVIVPLKTQATELVIPPFVVKEWRHMVSMDGSRG